MIGNRILSIYIIQTFFLIFIKILKSSHSKKNKKSYFIKKNKKSYFIKKNKKSYFIKRKKFKKNQFFRFINFLKNFSSNYF